MTDQNNADVYPVYILSEVAYQIFEKCKEAVPKETLGRLIGYRLQWQNRDYVKIVDWASGELDSSSTHAQFTARGIRECEIFLDERYGTNKERPIEIGLFHSHPFGTNPHFSHVDYQTFLTFPYNQQGNVFILIDPLSAYFKVYIIEDNEKGEQDLKQVHWICYAPSLQNDQAQ